MFKKKICEFSPPPTRAIYTSSRISIDSPYWIMEIHYSIMEIHSSVMELIMEIHNNGIFIPFGTPHQTSFWSDNYFINVHRVTLEPSQIAMIQRSASVHPAHGNERASAGAPPAFRPRVRYKLDRYKPRWLPSRVTLAHCRRNWHTSALKAGRLPARVPPAWRQRSLTMENASALSRESRDSNASLTAVTAWRVGVC